jgi:hypothetical protein
VKLNEDQLCLNLRQSSDGKIYQSIKECLPIISQHVKWKIEKDFSYLKLSICSKKHRNICGNEIEMKEGKFNFQFLIKIIFSFLRNK